MNSVPLFQLSCHSYLFLCGPSLMSYVPFSLSSVGLSLLLIHLPLTFSFIMLVLFYNTYLPKFLLPFCFYFP